MVEELFVGISLTCLVYGSGSGELSAPADKKKLFSSSSPFYNNNNKLCNMAGKL